MRGQGAYSTASMALNAAASLRSFKQWASKGKRVCWRCQKEFSLFDGESSLINPQQIGGGGQKFICYGCIECTYAKQQDNEIRIEMAQHSYSGIKAYETCPRQYHETKVLKLYPREETEATLYGTQLHEQAELYIKEDRPLDESFKFLQPTLDALKAMPGVKYCEYEMALKETLEVCDFKDPDYWVRGIADLVIVDEANFTARVFDYKSGSDKYADTNQLMLMAMMIFKHFPKVKQVSGGLLFVLKGTVQKYRVSRDQEHILWWKWRERVAKLDASHYHDMWHAKPSGLCRKYCPCVGCEHNGRRA